MKTKAQLRAELRIAVADYMWTEGCGCCGDYEGHIINKDRLGKLLRVQKDKDGLYDWDRYRTKGTRQ